MSTVSTCVTPEALEVSHTEYPVSSGRVLGIEETDAPPSAVSALEKWNYPRHNVARLMATFWSFVVSGANDAAYGVCYPILSLIASEG